MEADALTTLAAAELARTEDAAGLARAALDICERTGRRLGAERATTAMRGAGAVTTP